MSDAVTRHGMSFSEALETMEAGHRACLEGWLDNGQWVCKGEGGDCAPANFWNIHTKRVALDRFKAGGGEKTPVLPYFILKTCDDQIQMGWQPSTEELLSREWCLLRYADEV
jgi:hypothetical protein